MDLVELLAERGIEQVESTLRTKVSTGKMGATMLVCILDSLGVKEVSVEGLMRIKFEIAESIRK